jgi:hypothetical protein
VSVEVVDDDYSLGLEPRNRGAAGMWVVASDSIDVQVGESNSRWEFSYSDRNISTVYSILQAVIDGRVQEV